MAGCATLAEKNRSNLFNLKIGMTKSEALSIMDKPSKTEAYEIQGKNWEFWLYFIGHTGTTFALREEYIPLAFEEGILKGWGRNYYDQALRIKQDIKIEQK